MILTKENYFTLEADQEYFSNSQFKGFMECEARQMALLNGKWKKKTQDYFLVGSYLHAWNEGVLDQFIKDHPEVISSAGKTKGEFKADFKKANALIEFLEKDWLFMEALKGEKEVIICHELFGAKWKGMLDSYNKEERMFTDLKYLKSLDQKEWVQTETEGHYENVFEYRGYFTQMGLYAELERLVRGGDENDYFEPFIAAVTKEEYPDKDIISFASSEIPIHEFVQSQLMIVEPHMERLIQVKSGKRKPRRCEKCNYCKSTKKLTGTTFYMNYSVY